MGFVNAAFDFLRRCRTEVRSVAYLPKRSLQLSNVVMDQRLEMFTCLVWSCNKNAPECKKYEMQYSLFLARTLELSYHKTANSQVVSRPEILSSHGTHAFPSSYRFIVVSRLVFVPRGDNLGSMSLFS